MEAKAAARIQALTMSPGWDDLKSELEVQEEKFWKRHIADIKAGKPIDQRELDRALGKLDGIRALLGVPDKAARSLLRQTQDQEDDGA
jgi:hypothetical protein